MDTPLVSVILPTYNGVRYISDAIDSVLAQDYKNFELIIIDDASIDNTSEILRLYEIRDARIKIFRNELNLKLVASLNKGISLAQGKYIARIDDDDIWIHPSKLSRQVEYMRKNKNLGVVGTFAEIIDDLGNKTNKYIIHESNTRNVQLAFGLRNQLIHTSILARRDVLMRAGGYKKDWLYVEDFDLWLRIMALGYEIANIPEYMVFYRMRSGNTTAKKYRTMQWLTFLRLLQEKHVYLNTFRKILYLSCRAFLLVVPMRILHYLKIDK